VTHKSWLKRACSTIAAGLAAATVFISGQAAANETHFQDIVARGVLRVGVLGAFKPWSFRAPDGSMQGIEIDLAQNIADTIGVKLEPVVISSANRMEFLKQGKIDLIIGGMSDRLDRRKVVGVVEPAYWTSGPTLLAKKNAIKSWEDIAGKPVCGTQGVFYNKIVETKYKAKIIAFTGLTEAKEALRSGKCFALIYDDAPIMAEVAGGAWNDYEMPVSTIYPNPWGMAVPLEERDGVWGTFISGMTYKWHSSGYLLELEKKWNLRPSEWLASQHEKLNWDRGYLTANN